MKINTDKNAVIKGLLGTASSFALLKALQNSADPYTRVAIGSIAGFGIAALTESEYQAIGVGIFIGSALQMMEVLEGARITRNKYPENLYALDENKGIMEITAGQVPDYPVEGFTYKGLKGVYKLADGVHCHINQEGKIQVPGIGSMVNAIKNGGYHDKSWCEQIADKDDGCWVELYMYSV